MMCLICSKSETIQALTAVNFQRGEMRLVIREVPALLCPSCGEAYVSGPVAVSLLQQAEMISRQGTMDRTIEYEAHRDGLPGPS